VTRRIGGRKGSPCLPAASVRWQPGQELRLSGDDTIWVTAERSGDGQWLRFVRHTRNGYHVFKTVRF